MIKAVIWLSNYVRYIAFKDDELEGFVMVMWRSTQAKMKK